MNKTININLGGFFFHIDENAFQKLNRYLNAIKKSLSDDPQGKNEIISDIEARISELLSEKVTDVRQVVNENDIDEIINIMGQPEDYRDAEDHFSDKGYSYTQSNTTGKKLYRDGEDKFLGGVASGIAHYLAVDSIWIRLLLIALVVGGGFGFIIYVILWILVPEAKTTAEKLQMEGEPVNIDNIEKKIREEFTTVSGKIKDAADGVSDTIKNSNLKSGLQDFLDALGNIFLTLFKILGKCIGVFLIIGTGGFLIFLIIGLFSLGSFEFLNIDSELINVAPFFYEATLPSWLLILFCFVLIVIPVLIIFALGLRILSNSIKRFSKITSLTLLGIWLIALFGMIFTGVEIGTSKAYDGNKIEENSLNIMATDTLHLNVINDHTLFYQSRLRRSSKSELVEVDGENMLYSNNLKINVEQSTSGNAYIQIRRTSEGRTRSVANKNAAQLRYNFILENNQLNLDAYFLSDVKNRLKNEAVKVTVFIPENVTLFFSKSSKGFLYHIDNTDDIYDRDMVQHHFLMTDTGLDCTDCDTSNSK